jgi:hypothetical protein
MSFNISLIVSNMTEKCSYIPPINSRTCSSSALKFDYLFFITHSTGCIKKGDL